MFHLSCMSEKSFDVRCDGKHRCPQCLLIEVEEKRNFSRERTLAAQRCILDSMEWENNGAIPLLTDLRNEVEEQNLKTVEELLVSVRELWMSHKSVVAMVKAAETCRNEVEDFRRCLDCFEFRHNEEVRSFWFTCVCEKPHSLVYAKLGNHPFWPSKVVHFNAEQNKVVVKFFGSHQLGFVTLKNCYRLSTKYPDPDKLEPKSHSFKKAKEELERHIGKVKCRFGGFKGYVDDFTPFNPKIMFITDEEGVYDYSNDTGMEIDEYVDPVTNLSESTELCPSSAVKIGVQPNDCIITVDGEESQISDTTTAGDECSFQKAEEFNFEAIADDPMMQPRVMLERTPLLDALQRNKQIARVLTEALEELQRHFGSQIHS
ncbi:hypothetical protein B4U80_13576 [Leptotrombidium deliense]|uniref:PWWP domain-containing protein n=1 Tax=Leptotrombidium deliense TaxID=299467 RepID=A0A443S442_9ACAR|nr:hypothetical protein B4U80_13576 [Leptotrombidium deliense]